MQGQVELKQASFLKDIGIGTTLLGCAGCLDAKRCGGLHLRAGTITSCLDFCRCSEEERKDCPTVCPRKPEDLHRRIHEVVTFDLNNIPPTRRLALPDLPLYIPLVHGRSAANRSHEDSYIAMPMSYALVGRSAATRARTTRELQTRTGLKPAAGWILSGTEYDTFVERFWGLPNPIRIFEGMRRAGVVFATSPNFSLTNEVPRQDNLHAMKRIAWIWHLMQQAGIPTALHINGRTDFDFERWAEFVRKRPAVRAVAFEFQTGAFPALDRERYVARLRTFARLVGRRLHLVLRGPSSVVHDLRTSFSGVTVINSSAYQRAVHRRQAFVDDVGQIRFEPVATEKRSQVSALFNRNSNIIRLSLEAAEAAVQSAQARLPFWETPPKTTAASPTHSSTDDKAAQGELFPR